MNLLTTTEVDDAVLAHLRRGIKPTSTNVGASECRIRMSLDRLSYHGVNGPRFVFRVEDYSQRRFWRSPLRAPHHTVSAVGMRGEIRLATGGTLLLDNLPEFRRNVLALVGQEHFGIIRWTATSCPCGVPSRCTCTPESIIRWTARITESLALIKS